MQTTLKTNTIYLNLLEPNQGDGSQGSPFNRLEDALNAVRASQTDVCEVVVMSFVTLRSPLTLSKEYFGKNVVFTRGDGCHDVLFDVLETGRLIIGNGIILDGDKEQYKSAGQICGSLVRLNTGACLTLEGNATLKNNYAETGAAVHIGGGTFTMHSGAITECEAVQYGGAVAIIGGRMSMQGGEIFDNQAPKGAGVYVHGEFYICPNPEDAFRLPDYVHLERGHTLYIQKNICGILEEIRVVCEENSPRTNVAVCDSNLIATGAVVMEKVINAGEGTRRRLYYHGDLLYLKYENY